jgi:hypothetical protein
LGFQSLKVCESTFRTQKTHEFHGQIPAIQIALIPDEVSFEAKLGLRGLKGGAQSQIDRGREFATGMPGSSGINPEGG